MPIYEYISVRNGCQYCRQSFSAFRRLRDKPLQKCPKCGEKIKRIISSFSLGRNILSPSHLKKHGFTKLVKDGQGGYREET